MHCSLTSLFSVVHAWFICAGHLSGMEEGGCDTTFAGGGHPLGDGRSLPGGQLLFLMRNATCSWESIPQSGPPCSLQCDSPRPTSLTLPPTPHPVCPLEGERFSSRVHLPAAVPESGMFSPLPIIPLLPPIPHPPRRLPEVKAVLCDDASSTLPYAPHPNATRALNFVSPPTPPDPTPTRPTTPEPSLAELRGGLAQPGALQQGSVGPARLFV